MNELKRNTRELCSLKKILIFKTIPLRYFQTYKIQLFIKNKSPYLGPHFIPNPKNGTKSTLAIQSISPELICSLTLVKFWLNQIQIYLGAFLPPSLPDLFGQSQLINNTKSSEIQNYCHNSQEVNAMLLRLETQMSQIFIFGISSVILNIYFRNELFIFKVSKNIFIYFKSVSGNLSLS